MIRDEIIVKRYAEAFMGYAKTTCGPERAIADFKNLKSIMRENRGFGQILESPEITFAEKCDLLDKIMKDDFSEEIRNFLKLLLEKNRIEKLLDIIEYVRVTYSHGEEHEVLLKTSYPLDLVLIKEIEEKLARKFQRKFKFYIDLDGSLLGGIQVTIGHTVIDGTIRKRLEQLKEKLMAVQV
ncbi:MAG: ATP synthase F1 subunit delta [Candidatus Omnitrophica bacterium]|nr:ATP synthase F1 subunit delta [Candidatus Omnitrophota bacterium]MBU1870076.1 ATP synthase F1 subunit delta [Candidatus Omnitrophota bacterium]